MNIPRHGLPNEEVDIETIPRTAQHFEISRARVYVGSAQHEHLSRWPERGQLLEEAWPPGWQLWWEEPQSDDRLKTDLKIELGGTYRAQIQPSPAKRFAEFSIPEQREVVLGIEGVVDSFAMRLFIHRFEIDSLYAVAGFCRPREIWMKELSGTGLKPELTDPYGRVTWMILATGAEE